MDSRTRQGREICQQLNLTKFCRALYQLVDFFFYVNKNDATTVIQMSAKIVKG